jgi:hypothetical protein
LTVLKVITSSSAMRWFGVPTASIPSTSSSRPVSGSTRPGTRWRGASPGARSRAFPVECLHQPGEAAERDALGSGLFCLGDEQPTKQGTAARVGRWPELG